MTIDEALGKLNDAKLNGKLGGYAVLVLSLSGSGVENVAVDDVVTVNDLVVDGAVVEVRVAPLISSMQ